MRGHACQALNECLLRLVQHHALCGCHGFGEGFPRHPGLPRVTKAINYRQPVIFFGKFHAAILTCSPSPPPAFNLQKVSPAHALWHATCSQFAAAARNAKLRRSQQFPCQPSTSNIRANRAKQYPCQPLAISQCSTWNTWNSNFRANRHQAISVPTAPSNSRANRPQAISVPSSKFARLFFARAVRASKCASSFLASGFLLRRSRKQEVCHFLFFRRMEARFTRIPPDREAGVDAQDTPAKMLAGVCVSATRAG